MTRDRSLTLLVILMMLVTMNAWAADRIRVHVVSPPATEGFVDDTLKGQQDTVSDLAARLAENPLLELVDDPAAADIVVEVRGRGRQETGEMRTLTMRSPLGLVSRTERDETKTITIVLRAGTYEKEFSAKNDQVFGAWKAMAGRLAKEIATWVRANEPTLRARRTA